MNNSASNTKQKNTIIKDAMVLFVITLVAGFALGAVYRVTKPIIDERALGEKAQVYQGVYEIADSFTEDVELSERAQTAPEDLFAKNGFNNIAIDEILVAQDPSGNTIGHVLSVTTSDGYGGDITMSLGYSLESVMQGLDFLVLNETVGFGQNAQSPEFKDQFSDKQVTEFVSTKLGASQDNEINAISGATITTDAITGAINASLLFLNETANVNN